MKNVCEHCGESFEGRWGAKTCSDRCRVAKSRTSKKQIQHKEITVVGDEGLPRLLDFCNANKVTITNIIDFIEERKLAFDKKFNVK